MNETVNREPCDVHAKLEDPVGVLAVALAQWEIRDDTRPQPEIRRAANTAVDAIDVMLRELHLMRARLMSEIRVNDDIAMARSAEFMTRSAELLERPLPAGAGAITATVTAADRAAPPGAASAGLLERARKITACPDHQPVHDSAAGWYCAACGSDAPPQAAEAHDA